MRGARSVASTTNHSLFTYRYIRAYVCVVVIFRTVNILNSVQNYFQTFSRPTSNEMLVIRYKLPQLSGALRNSSTTRKSVYMYVHIIYVYVRMFVILCFNIFCKFIYLLTKMFVCEMAIKCDCFNSSLVNMYVFISVFIKILFHLL